MIRTLVLPLGIAASLWMALSPSATANLLVAPTRLILESGQRHSEFILVNKGHTTQRYRLSLVGRRMTDDGRIVPAETPETDERFAHNLLRFSPRMVTLPPNEPQTVRVMVRDLGDLERGEYRSHLLFQQMPETPPAAPEPSAAGTRAQGISIKLNPIFGVAVPLIIRHGSLEAEGGLSKLSLEREEEGLQLRIQIQRSGDRSLYGNLEVRHEVDGQEPRVVGSLGGVAVYTPNSMRPVAIQLPGLNGLPPRHGRLVVEYREAESGASSLIAEAALDLASP